MVELARTWEVSATRVYARPDASIPIAKHVNVLEFFNLSNETISSTKLFYSNLDSKVRLFARELLAKMEALVKRSMELRSALVCPVIQV